MAEKELKLKVAEAVDEDKNNTIARIDQNYLEELNVKIGEIVEIIGEKRALAIAKKSYPGDDGLGLIRVNKTVRDNAGINIGKIINVRKSNQLKL